jgi:putative phosphoesterase
MKRILLLSDTHGCIDDFILKHAQEADELWHAGDIGPLTTADNLSRLKPLRGVYGNIDDYAVRLQYPETLCFNVDDLRIGMIHIAGLPGKYLPKAKTMLQEFRPDVLICGHSHLLKIVRDPVHRHLHLNPGAAGVHGFHKVRTMVRFIVEGGKIREMDVLEIPRKTAST